MWEQKVSITSAFITLTYADEYLPIHQPTGEGTFSIPDLQNFFKRLRKLNEKDNYAKTITRSWKQSKNGRIHTADYKPIRYYLSSEYGGLNGRPHYHIILFNCQRETLEKLHTVWPIGNIDISRVSSDSIGYVCAYHVNGLVSAGARPKPFALMSRKTGIGSNYINSNLKWHRDENHPNENKFYVLDNNHKRRLPRFYKSKIFTKDEIQEGGITFQQQEEIRAKAIYALRDYHKEPDSYYYLQIKQMHDEIAIKWKNKKLHL